ncbi:MAG: sensor histidine kinase, partial [Microvirga sp.]
MIGRVRGPASDDGSRRRRLAKDVRNVRERLTSSIGLERAFDHELIRLFAEYRTSASVPLFGLAAAISAVATVWIPLQNALLWLILVTAAMALMLTLSQRFLREDPDSVALETWRRRFILGETLQGASWALIVQVLIPVEAAGARSFLLFVLVMLAALIAMLSATIPAAVYAGLVPVALAILTLTLSAPDRDTIMLMAMAGSAQFFFIFLANRLYCSAVATLQSRAEKDAIFAELEQAKANSDEARRRAEEANLAKSRFLATMSHELRTPLNAILAMAEALQEDGAGALAPAQRDCMTLVQSSGKHLLALINDVLDLAKIGAGTLELRREPLDVASVCAEALLSVRELAARKGIQVHQRLAADTPPVPADHRRLRQMLINLLSNAVKFTPDGGAIGVESRLDAPAGRLCLEVWD